MNLSLARWPWGSEGLEEILEQKKTKGSKNGPEATAAQPNLRISTFPRLLNARRFLAEYGPESDRGIGSNRRQKSEFRRPNGEP